MKFSSPPPIASQDTEKGLHCQLVLRDYAWDDSSFPARITSQGTPLLDGPAETLLDGRPASPTEFQVRSQAPHRVEALKTWGGSLYVNRKSWNPNLYRHKVSGDQKPPTNDFSEVLLPKSEVGLVFCKPASIRQILKFVICTMGHTDVLQIMAITECIFREMINIRRQSDFSQ